MVFDYSKIVGWYDDPGQVYPARVPADDALCPICLDPLGERTEARYTSIMDWDARGRSYFYGFHPKCGDQPHEHITHAVMDWIVDHE